MRISNKHLLLGVSLKRANELLAALDLDKITEVAELGDEDGFDQLVLPSGHKDMVKSLIRQHLRDKKTKPADNDQIDIVRGKGTVQNPSIDS